MKVTHTRTHARVRAHTHEHTQLIYNGANNSTLSVSSSSESMLSTGGRSLIIVQTLTLWQRVGGLLHTVSTRVDELSVDSFKVFFTRKVDAIRAKTESAHRH